MAKRSVTILTQSDFEESWTDSNCPNMVWFFLEENLEDCLQDDGTYIATYESLEVPEGETMTFTYLTSTGSVSYTLQPGEYGVKPK